MVFHQKYMIRLNIFLLLTWCLVASGDTNDYYKLVSSLPPIPCRSDLAKVAQDYFFHTKKAAEIRANIWASLRNRTLKFGLENIL